jgi:Protein of unknown function (DUF3501)
MAQLSRDEIRTGADYESARESERREIALDKQDRRIDLGAKLTLVFENAKTLRHTVEELLRAERVVHELAIATEVEDFSTLAPEPNSLSACLYAHVADNTDLATTTDQLAGVAESLTLTVGDQRIVARVTEGGIETALACFITFVLTDAQRQALESGSLIAVDVDHPAASGHFELTPAQRQALTADLS